MFHLILITSALAGKLEDGWRGIPYGDASVLTTAPTASCRAAPEPGTLWVCDELVGGAPVSVTYIGSDGLYVGVMIRAKGYTDCKVLFDTVTAAWSVPFTKQSEYDRSVLPDGFWNLSRYRTTTAAAWEYNQFTGACHASTLNAKLTEVIDAAKARRASDAAAEL